MSGVFRSIVRITLLLLALAVGGLLVLYAMIRMPGKSHQGPLDPLSPALKDLAVELIDDVARLSRDIGERNVMHYGNLRATADFIEESLIATGLEVVRFPYTVEGKKCDNLVATIPGNGRADEIIVVGAHYDSVLGCPGANDNASGVAGLLAAARRLAKTKPSRTLRLVAFVNEEPYFFQRESMGSWVYARQCRRRGDNIVGAIVLETIGYYSVEKGSQHYPSPVLRLFYPSKADFIAFVGNRASSRLVKQTVGMFRRHARFPSEGAAMPEWVPGIGWSDHWSFWQEGYEALMVTDTAPFRYQFYHTPEDTPEKLDYDRMARVVDGLIRVIASLAETSLAETSAAEE